MRKTYKLYITVDDSRSPSQMIYVFREVGKAEKPPLQMIKEIWSRKEGRLLLFTTYVRPIPIEFPQNTTVSIFFYDFVVLAAMSASFTALEFHFLSFFSRFSHGPQLPRLEYLPRFAPFEWNSCSAFTFSQVLHFLHSTSWPSISAMNTDCLPLYLNMAYKPMPIRRTSIGVCGNDPAFCIFYIRCSV